MGRGQGSRAAGERRELCALVSCEPSTSPDTGPQRVEAAPPQSTKIAHHTEEQEVTLWDRAADLFRGVSDIAGGTAVSSAAAVQASSLRRLFCFSAALAAVPAVPVVTCFLLTAV